MGLADIRFLGQELLPHFSLFSSSLSVSSFHLDHLATPAAVYGVPIAQFLFPSPDSDFGAYLHMSREGLQPSVYAA